jgi:dCTP diphosphatase
MPTKELSLKQLKEKVKLFVQERDWQQFHNPKNLSMNLSIEASELMELFLWCTSEDSLKAYKDKEQDAQDEVADILFGLLCFCNATGIDLEQAFLSKFKKIAAKYPVDKCKGKSLKYTEL